MRHPDTYRGYARSKFDFDGATRTRCAVPCAECGTMMSRCQTTIRKAQVAGRQMLCSRCMGHKVRDDGLFRGTKRAHLRDRLEQVVALLVERDEPLTALEIADGLGVSHRQARRILQRIEAHVWVRTGDDWHDPSLYWLTELGEQMARGMRREAAE